MSEDESALRWSRLNKNSFRTFLSDRYGRKIADKMLNFLELQFGSLYRMEYKSFIKLVKDFLKGGPNIW